MNNDEGSWYENIITWVGIALAILVIIFLYWLFAPSQVCTPYIDSQGVQQFKCENYPFYKKLIGLFT